MQFHARADVKRVLARDLESLRGRAVEDLVAATQGLVRWADRVRDALAPYRFRWAVESLRAADVASTSYILNRLVDAGAIDRVLTPQQQRAGRRWIRSLEVAPESYEDPALLAYKPPQWDDTAEPWPPTAAHKEAMNQYARGCLRGYGDLSLDAIHGPPRPDWPQQHQADQVLAWIQKVEPNWSWIGRMIRRLMDWYLAGTTGLDPLLECLRWAYSRQDPRTGFWAGGIQTTFKIIIAVLEPLGLPVPHAERLVDSVLRTMYRRDYDDNLFPCEEFDAFYDIAAGWQQVPEYRRDEVLKWAAYRISFILNTHVQEDEGLASYPDHCIPTWLKWDMAPPLPQGDAFGLAIFGAGFDICVDLLGVQQQTGWTGSWRYGDARDATAYRELGREVAAQLGLAPRREESH